MYLSIIILPFLGSLISALFGRLLGIKGTQLITIITMLLATLFSIIAFYEVALSNSPVTINVTDWIDSELLTIYWAFTFDSLTVSMLLPVLIVSLLVHIYSINYMYNDPHQQRFFSYLSMFTFFMVILVTGNNYLILFLGWELIGVSSYLLINFWFTRLQANKAAIQAIIVNRIGDMSLSISFFILFWIFGDLNYTTIFSASPYINEYLLTIVGILFLIASIGKSAQIGLHIWLPWSMEGPTPVSALIHAATLVTAGVYLLLRSSPLLEYSPTTLVVITWIGALTAFFAASIGLLQNDIKRIIAYSTCSQMGYLFMAVGISQYNVALFHLINHAFFKAVLFLAAGGVLHSINDQQDIRRLGGLIKLLPFTYTIILIGSLSLMALPFLTGFYSKDLILELGFSAFLSDRTDNYSVSGGVVYILGSLTAMITAFYSFRLISMLFLTVPNNSKINYINVHEQSYIIVIPLTILALFSIFFGYFAKDSFVGIGSDLLSSSLFILPINTNMVEAEFSVPTLFKLLPGICSVTGALLALLMFNRFYDTTINLSINHYTKHIYNFLNGKWYIDIIFTYYLVTSTLYLGMITSKVLDKGIIELFGPFGITNSLNKTSHKITFLDTGIVTQYALYMMIAFIVILLLLFSSILIPTVYLLIVNHFNLLLLYIICSLTISNFVQD